AIKAFNGYTLGDKQLYVGRFQNKNERRAEIKRQRDSQLEERMKKYEGLNLFIKNLDDTIDDERLKKEFDKFGTVTSAKVMTDGRRSKGFGFVSFAKPDEAERAITEMNGTIVGSKGLHVDFLEQKADRRVRLTNEHQERIRASRIQNSQMQSSSIMVPCLVMMPLQSINSCSVPPLPAMCHQQDELTRQIAALFPSRAHAPTVQNTMTRPMPARPNYSSGNDAD
ncbi:unnamed protein product, partial [Didymodactylos carnosus]